MRLAVAIFVAALAASTTAQAGSRYHCTRAPGDYVGGPNAWMMWTDDVPGRLGGTAYGDIGLHCTSTHDRRHTHLHIHHRWRYAHYRVHRPAWRSHHRWRHTYTVHRSANWVNVPLENVGGLCPRGHCGLLDTGAHRHYREWLYSQE